MIVKWCLNLKLMSCRTYNALRSTLVLPSERTPRDYTHCFDSKLDHDNMHSELLECSNDCIMTVYSTVAQVRLFRLLG